MVETYVDPFESLLELEDTFYTEGYDLGVADGKRAGLIEGRFFGLEKGFEKYASMGRLYGKAVIWAGRLAPVRTENQARNREVVQAESSMNSPPPVEQELRETSPQSQGGKDSGQVRLPTLPPNLRLEKHIRTLYALVEPISLAAENTEEAVSDFDDRLKRAEGKVKIIKKITGETKPVKTDMASDQGMILRSGQKRSGDGSIEEINSLHVRH